MSERAAFVAAIRAEPYEDTPRLAFADWLDEHGEHDRAEFIRVQIELSRMKPPQILQPMELALEDDSDCFTLALRDRRSDPRRARVRLHEGTVIIRGEVVDVRFDSDSSVARILGCIVEEVSPLEERDLIVFEATLLIGPDGYPQRSRRNELLVRERELLDAGGAATLAKNKFRWLGDALREAVVFGEASPEESAAALEWRRGFIASLACSAADWIAHADEILAEHPVRAVLLTEPLNWMHRESRVWLHSGDFEYGPRRVCRNVGIDDKVADIVKGITYVRGILAREWPGVEFTGSVEVTMTIHNP